MDVCTAFKSGIKDEDPTSYPTKPCQIACYLRALRVKMLEVISWSEGLTTIRLKGTCCKRFIIPGPYNHNERAQVW